MCQESDPSMSRSLGWAIKFSAPTKVEDGLLDMAPDFGTPPSPSINPSLFTSFDCGTIDQEPCATGVVGAWGFVAWETADGSSAKVTDIEANSAKACLIAM